MSIFITIILSSVISIKGCGSVVTTFIGEGIVGERLEKLQALLGAENIKVYEIDSVPLYLYLLNIPSKLADSIFKPEVFGRGYLITNLQNNCTRLWGSINGVFCNFGKYDSLYEALLQTRVSKEDAHDIVDLVNSLQ